MLHAGSPVLLGGRRGGTLIGVERVRLLAFCEVARRQAGREPASRRESVSLAVVSACLAVVSACEPHAASQINHCQLSIVNQARVARRSIDLARAGLWI